MGLGYIIIYFNMIVEKLKIINSRLSRMPDSGHWDFSFNKGGSVLEKLKNIDSSLNKISYDGDSDSLKMELDHLLGKLRNFKELLERGQLQEEEINNVGEWVEQINRILPS